MKEYSAPVTRATLLEGFSRLTDSVFDKKAIFLTAFGKRAGEPKQISLSV